MNQKTIFHPAVIWATINFLASALYWRQVYFLKSDQSISFSANLPNLILAIVFINLILVILAVREKETIFAYIINSLTIYFLILVILQNYWLQAG